MNTLKTFFSEEYAKSKNENILIFDMHNLIFRTLHVANYSYTQSWSQEVKTGFDGPKAMSESDMYFYWKYLMINSIFTAMKNFEPDKLIFAIDGGKGSWRKDVYPLYKANRKVARDKSTIDFVKFFPVLDQFLEDMKAAFKNVYFLRIDRVEGDDIIAVLAKDILDKNANTTIVSSDRDLVQLMKNKNVRLFDPLKKSFIKSLNPGHDLLIKIISGDSSDNIPAIKKRCGKATAVKILNDGIDVHLVDDEIKNNYKRNTQLIDFNYIPLDIRNGIKDQYNTYNLSKYDGMLMFNFLMKNKVNKFVDDLQTIYGPMLRKLS